MGSAAVQHVPARPARALVGIGSALALVAATFGAAGPGQATEPDPAGMQLAEQSYQVTLITGDVVTWRVLADGKVSATVDEARAGASFQVIESGEDHYVIPDDVAPLLGERLDRELFNVAALVEQGYHDGEVDAVPVIVTGTGPAGAGQQMNTAYPAAAALTEVSPEEALVSIDGFGGSVGHEEATAMGEALADLADRAAQDPGARSSGLPAFDKIWLDHRVTVDLAESVPQTGAPQAWAAGYDGTGTRVAVLDTGIDQAHPDIAGQVVATADFTDSGSAADRVGHGTHVAATVAGTGDASDGLRTGVAPGAEMVVGKVLADDGRGTASWAIAGMQWAAVEQDADVINMSLGADPTDGTDPMSQAVNTLTEEQDALFVISAGNSGPGAHTVGTPGTADAALTVGSVDKDHALAYNSSRGPRLGDYAIKPDLTAPGVDIVAARAAGTAMGYPVDDLYTSASGTSMAAPHVAGAAAILHQQHPDWDPATLKGALVGTAVPRSDLSVYEQGAGELDVATAVEREVVATPGTLDLGYFRYPHDEVATRTLSYANHGAEPVTLDLALSLTDPDGSAPPAGMVTLERSTVTIAPGEQAEVNLTVDESVGPPALYGGVVVATDPAGEQVARTPTGLFKEEEMYQLTVHGIDRSGDPAARPSRVDVMNAVDTRETNEYVYLEDGTATLRLPPGTYSVMGVVYTPDGSGSYTGQTMLGDPELELSQDTTLTWDAREATEITVDVGEPVDKIDQQLAYHRAASETGEHTNNRLWLGGDWPYSAVPTESAELGYFELYTQYVLADDAEEPSRYYDLVLPEPDAIPADLDYRITEQNSATVRTAYHSDVPDHEYFWQRLSFRPFERMTYDITRQLTAPTEQVDVVSAGAGTRWRHWVRGENGRLDDLAAVYQPGEQVDQTWFAGPNTPTLRQDPLIRPEDRPSREGDTLAPHIMEWGDARIGEHRPYGFVTGLDSTAFRLFEDGELVAEAPRATYGTFEVSPGPSRIRMELDVARESEHQLTSTATHTAWEFDSEHSAERTWLPLLQVDYDLDLALDNTAPHPRDVRGPFRIGLQVSQPEGIEGPTVQGARGWLSYDDGDTWLARPLRQTGEGTFELVADRRAGGEFVSIRVEAWDSAGSTVEQEVIRAYRLTD